MLREIFLRKRLYIIYLLLIVATLVGELASPLIHVPVSGKSLVKALKREVSRPVASLATWIFVHNLEVGYLPSLVPYLGVVYMAFITFNTGVYAGKVIDYTAIRLHMSIPWDITTKLLFVISPVTVMELFSYTIALDVSTSLGFLIVEKVRKRRPIPRELLKLLLAEALIGVAVLFISAWVEAFTVKFFA